MKKLLIFTNILTLVLLYFSSFTKNDESAKELNKPNCSTICANYTNNPVAGIGLNTASNMAGGYALNQWKILNQNQPHQETKSVWFSLDRLKAFIWEIENRTCVSSCKTKLNLGVRIYLASYPDLTNPTNPDYYDVKKQYGKHITMFMVPTYKLSGKPNTENVDFDPRNMGANFCRPTPLKSLMDPKWPHKNDPISKMDIRNMEEMKSGPYAGEFEITKQTKGVIGNVPPVRALILTAMEAQGMYPRGKGLAKVQGPQIMNHGNNIPPDVDDGATY